VRRISTYSREPVKRRLRATLLAGGLLAGFCSLFVHPYGKVKERFDASGPILGGATASPAVVAIVEKSCQNCHSGRTEWPWYSYIAPMSWMVEKDVREARAHMDLTQWQMYDENKKSESLSAIGSAVRNRVMPPRRYIVLHPEARLTDEEIDQVYRWTRDERRRSRQSAPGN
jgi:hypothetical protein